MNKEIIKSISYDQKEILRWILELHVPSKKIDCDVTYSKGMFYKNSKIEQPDYKFDIFPVKNDVIQADCVNLPVKDKSFNCIIYDPPFVVCHSKKAIVINRYGSFPTIKKLWAFYRASIKELTRALKPDGTLIVKCQDLAMGGRNFQSHVEIMNSGVLNGLYPKDLFILLATRRLMSPNQFNQFHARKYHCYFWVFKRATKGAVKYDTLLDKIILS